MLRGGGRGVVGPPEIHLAEERRPGLECQSVSDSFRAGELKMEGEGGALRGWGWIWSEVMTMSATKAAR